jgi:hypothetical protein
MSGPEPEDPGRRPTEWVEPLVGRNMHDFRHVMRRVIPILQPHENVTALFAISAFRHQLDFVALTQSRMLAGNSTSSTSNAVHVRLEGDEIASVEIDKKRKISILLRSGGSVDLGKLSFETDRIEFTRRLTALISQSNIFPATEGRTASDMVVALGSVSQKLDDLERIANLLASDVITREQAERLRDELLEQ